MQTNLWGQLRLILDTKRLSDPLNTLCRSDVQTLDVLIAYLLHIIDVTIRFFLVEVMGFFRETIRSLSGITH